MDNEGNDTVSKVIRVIIDNSHAYPTPVDLYSIDHIFTNSIFSGYNLKWRSSADPYFAQYILQRSENPLMTNSSEIFSTSDKSITIFEDGITVSEGILYYRIKVEDIFGKQTPGNVISTSMINMPLAWEIQSVQYTLNSLLISWNNPPFDNYEFHRLLYSDAREGSYEVLEIYADSTKFQYQSDNFITTSAENWFSVLTGDYLGQMSISQPKMHPPPQDPMIDSILYTDQTFTLTWSTEPENDFSQYQILHTQDEDPYNLFEAAIIDIRTDTTVVVSNVIESEYYLYQIITEDAWGLETKGPIVIASSFYKFSKTIGNNANDELFPLYQQKMENTMRLENLVKKVVGLYK